VPVSRIRMLERGDLPGVCRLYEAVVRSGSPDPPPQLVEYFERTLLDYPWTDPTIPSLVCEDTTGEIVGFLGSHVRRLRVDGRPIRMACSGQQVTSPGARHRGVGALLTRRYLAGPQEITITDGATDLVRRMWTGLGGQPLAHASIGWTRVFRPAATGMASLSRRNGHAGLTRSLRFVAPPLDAAARMVLRGKRELLPAEPEADAEPLTIGALLSQMRAAACSVRLHPDYDAEFLRWLFGELEVVDVRGGPVRRLVRDRAGRVAGWYVYYLLRGGVAQVLQIAAPSGDSGLVLDHLFWDAACGGAVAVRGRLEPSLLGLLESRRCLLHPTEWALVHCRDQSLLGLLGSPKALLTRLDGEWWMGHHLLWRERSRRGGPATATHTEAPPTAVPEDRARPRDVL
jgi:hypothetical protein